MANDNKKILEQKLADQEKAILEYQKRTGHKRPVTRREFLSAGIISVPGMMVIPSVLDMLVNVNPAYAAECAAAATTSTAIPFITVNMSGGWAGTANWVPRDIGGQLLPSYNQMGLGKVPATTTAFANSALFAQSSDATGFLAGVKGSANAAIQAKTSFVGVPVRSGDDTGNNRFDIGGLLQAASLRGEKLPYMGTKATATGINHLAALSKNPSAPLRVGSINDILGALGVAGSLAVMNQAQQLSLAKLVSNLSTSQARNLASLSGGQNVANLVECATGKNVENIAAGSGNVDPRLVPAVNGAGIWNTANATELARAGMVMNALNGLGGAVGIDLDGYDYHGNPRATTDARDLAGGKLVGQILATANALGKPVFIYVTSDGSVNFDVSDNAGTDANGDNGGKGSVYMIAFNPVAAPVTKGTQLGGFTAGQVADNTVPWGGNPETAAAAVFANWAALSGKTADITKVLGTTFSQAQLNQLLMFG